MPDYYLPDRTPDWIKQLVADTLDKQDWDGIGVTDSAKVPLDPAFVLSQQIDDQAIAAKAARGGEELSAHNNRGYTSYANTPDPDAMDKRIDALADKFDGLVGLLDRLTTITDAILTRLTVLEAAQRQPTTVAVDGQNGPGEVREVQNDTGGESDALHRSSTYPVIPDEWKKYANPPPVETAKKWRLYAAGRPKQGRRIDVLRQTGLLRYVLFVSHDALARPDDPIIAWRYAK